MPTGTIPQFNFFVRKTAIKEIFDFMKTIRLIAAVLFVAAFSALSTFAQTAAVPAGTVKIAVIDTGAFGAEQGIAKYISAAKQLDTEFQPRRSELQTMNTQLQGLAKEVETLRAQIQQPNSPVKPETLEQKADQAQKLQRDMQYKQQEAEAAYQKRSAAVMGPIVSDIMKSVQDFANQKGYAMVFDLNKMAQDGSLIALSKTIDATDEFIAFYNKRPAGSAAK